MFTQSAFALSKGILNKVKKIKSVSKKKSYDSFMILPSALDSEASASNLLHLKVRVAIDDLHDVCLAVA